MNARSEWSSKPSLAYGLRTAGEVVLLGCVSVAVAASILFGSTPVMNAFGSWGIDLSFLDILSWLAVYLLPPVACFVYGLRRERLLSFYWVWLGWAIAVAIPGAAMSLLFGPHYWKHSHAHFHPTLLWRLLSWTVFLAEVAIMATIPALLTMWGQSWRTRRRTESRSL